LTQQNKDLQRELDSFVETDDIVRRNLDRKEKVHEIRTKVDFAISQSHSNYPKASPAKSPARRDQIQASQFNLQSVQSKGHTLNTRDFSPAKKQFGGNSPLRQRSGSRGKY